VSDKQIVREMEHSPSSGSKDSKKRQLEEEEEEEVSGSEGEGEEDSDDDDDPELSDLDDDEKDMEVQVDFAFFDPEEIDFHAIKNFLLPYLTGQSLNASELANLIIAQNNYVGTVVKVEGEDETYGFVSVINVHKHKNLTAVKQIKEYFLSQAPSQAERARLEALFNDETKPLGLLLNERLLNLPPQLAPHLHKALFTEIQAAVEDGETSYRFENYLMLSSQYSHSSGDSTKKPKFKKGRTGDEIYFNRAEEEFYQKESSFFFTFPVMHGEEASRWTLDGSLKDNRAVLVIHRSKIAHIMDQLFKVCA